MTAMITGIDAASLIVERKLDGRSPFLVISVNVPDVFIHTAITLSNLVKKKITRAIILMVGFRVN